MASFRENIYCEDTREDLSQQVSAHAAKQAEKRYDPYWTKMLHPEVLSCTLAHATDGTPHAHPQSRLWEIRLRYEKRIVRVLVLDQDNNVTVTSFQEEEPDV